MSTTPKAVHHQPIIPIGTILPFALSTANIPPGWLLCDGSPVPSQYKMLISLLGTPATSPTVVVKLPDLSGRTLIGTGTAATGTIYTLGEKGGQESVTLDISQMPSHQHTYNSPGGFK